MSRLVPLTIDLLDECRFQQEIEKAFKHLQEEHLTHMKRYGDDSKDSVSKLNITIELKCVEPKTEYFGIKANIKEVLPSPPTRITTGIGDTTQTGEMALFVRQQGSAEDSPKQMLLEEETSKNT